MANDETIERIRQQIMRFRELLAIMRARLDSAERAYDGLFSAFSPEDRRDMKEKDLQWKVAQTMVEDVSRLSTAVLQARYDARDLERAFEELYDIIMTEEE
jgi:hypothetical protein